MLFSHECENNTIKITLELAVKLKVDLSYANLQDANLKDANLDGANFTGANFTRANLEYSNFTRANLKDANLQDTNIKDVAGNSKEIKTLLCCKYKVSFTKDLLSIGCKQHKISEWKNFSDDEIAQMDDGELELWIKWKDFIFMAIDLSEE